MRSRIAYSSRHTPLAEAGALAASVYLGAFAAVAFLYSNPIVLAGAGAGVIVAGVAAKAPEALRASARWGLALGAFIVAINGLVAQRGDTVVFHGLWLPLLGSTDVSAEAFAEGGVLALRIVVVLMAFGVHSACVDPDRVMRLVRPLARHSALTATLIARMVPLAAADHARLSEAAALRGPAAAPVGRAALARRLVAGSLDRAVDVAATLELRGHSLGVRPQRRRERSRDDLPLYLTGAAILGAGVAARIAGAGAFDTYPRISMGTGALTLALCVALIGLAAVPFALRRWRSRV